MTTNNETTRRGNRRRKQQTQSGSAPAQRMMQVDFGACSRCSHFLAGYRVIHGIQEMEESIARSNSEWLSLSWNEETRRLLQQSFGCRMDMDWFHIDFCCPECYRRYEVTLAGEEEDQKPNSFRAQLNKVPAGSTGI